MKSVHRLNLRIPEELYLQLVQQPDTMTATVCAACTQYLSGRQTDAVLQTDTTRLIDVLQAEVQLLQHDKEYLQQQNMALLLASRPFLQRWLLRLRGKSP